jgi:NADP-dependent 3-hydroxy acid dehydrogenase YdfG
VRALAGRTAIVTGASRGIGAAIARALVGAGARVALAARTRPALEQLADELGGAALVVVCDTTNKASVSAAAVHVREAFAGAPDIIVNNAGVFRVAPIESMPPEDFIASIETNLVGPFFVLREFLAEMRKRGSGHIVTIGSQGDRRIFTGNAAYSAAKFGLRAMHEVLRAELKGSGVRATLVSPASVDTQLWDELDTEGEGSDLPSRKQMLRPGAVVGAVIFALTQPATVNIDELRLSPT